jgi:Methyltransferase small domain
MIVSKLIPAPVLRRIDRLREWRARSVRAPLSREYVRRNGLSVRRGPFAGLSYPPGLEARVGDLVAKLTGSYEHELHAPVAEWIQTGYEQVIDIGCAEGYYAAGFAHAMPGATVHAFDIDEGSREECRATVAANGLEGRVVIGAECSTEVLASFPDHGVALLSDCEGAEISLLDPAAVPQLRNWPIIVELHDFIDPSISATIRSRFADSHEIEIIGSDQGLPAPPELDFLAPAKRRLVLSERRPAQMFWAHLRPR